MKWICLICLLWAAAVAKAGDLVVDLPEHIVAKDAVALAPPEKPGDDGPPTEGKIEARAITFSDLDNDTPYDLKITLSDGRVLRGADMSWYTKEPAQPEAGPVDDDDRQQISALISNVTSFYNISRIVLINGDHNRATVLVERIRSTPFHGAAAGETIWRVELWYFVNNYGGWQERPQTNKVLIRRRFESEEDFKEEQGPLHWVGELGGIRVGNQARHISLKPN